MQELQNQLYEQSKKNAAPVLEAYVEWVLREAQRRGIRTLYFLARDGYILRQIAQDLCEAKGIDIQCRYLYCSRMALRVPSYHLLGDETYDLLFMGGYHVTVCSFLERAGISEDEWDTVLAETGALQRRDTRREIAYAELGKYREMLLRSHTFRVRVRENSLKAYPAAVGYLRQEGLFDLARIGIGRRAIQDRSPASTSGCTRSRRTQQTGRIFPGSSRQRREKAGRSGFATICSSASCPLLMA